MASFTALSAATRPMRRDMFRAPLRLLAAVLLVALPVGYATFVSLINQAEMSTVNSFGSESTATYHGGSCAQSVDGSDSSCPSADQKSSNPDQLLTDALPAGLEAHRIDNETATFSFGSRTTTSEVSQYTSPNFSIHAPAVPGEGEIYLPSHVANTLEVGPGDVITAQFHSGEPQELTVIGILPGYESVVTAPTMPTTSAAGDDMSTFTKWTLIGDRPVNWDDVKSLNAAGFVVNSPDVVDNLPAESERYPEYKAFDSQASNWTNDLWESLSWLTVYATVLVLIMLLIAPVFALALNRHTRMFALMSTQGTTPGQIAAAVLTYALFAGILGATLGLVVGGAAAGAYWITTFSGWSMTIAWPTLAIIWLVAVVGSVAVAFIPARLAAKTALSAALGGAEPDRIVRWKKWMGIGPAILLIQALLLFVSSFDVLSPWLRIIARGSLSTLVAVLALAASAPALVFATAQLIRRTGLTGRFAGRGLLRSSMRSIPAVAAIMAFTFAITVVSSLPSNSRDEAMNHLFHPGEIALISAQNTTGPSDTSAAETQRAADIIASNVQVNGSWNLDGVFNTWYGNGPGASIWFDYPGATITNNRCEWTNEGYYQTPDGRDPETDPSAADDCYYHMRDVYSSGPLETAGVTAYIVDESNIDLWTFDTPEDRQAALDTLNQGGIVTSKADVVSLTPERTKVGVTFGEGDSTEEWTAHDVLAVAALPANADPYLISRQAAEELDLPVRFIGTAVSLDQHPGAKADDIAQQIEADTPGLFVRYTSYPVSDMWVPALIVGAISLIALVLIIALSAQSIRRDDSVLQAVGANPKLTAKIAAFRTWAISFAAMGIGVLGGHVARLLAATRDKYNINGDLLSYGEFQYMSINWWLVAAAVIVPLVAAGVAWFVHRSRGTELASVARDHGTDRSVT